MKIIFKRIFLLFLLIFLSFTITYGQLKIYQFEQLDSLQNVESRTIIVFIHTDWCKFCQAMKSKTFTDSILIKRINSKFYFIDFNAESQKDIYFKEKYFKSNSTKFNPDIHDLAIELAIVNKNITFPTLCFLNSNYEILFQYNQYLTAKSLINILDRLE